MTKECGCVDEIGIGADAGVCVCECVVELLGSSSARKFVVIVVSWSRNIRNIRKWHSFSSLFGRKLRAGGVLIASRIKKYREKGKRKQEKTKIPNKE